MKLLPDNPYEYLVYKDDFLLDIARENIIESLLKNNFKSITTESGTRQLINLNSIRLEEVAEYLNIPIGNFTEIKTEILLPCKSQELNYLYRTRFSDILPIDSKPFDKDEWGTSLYHTDFVFPLNNYKLIIYANDVSSEGGGTVITDPIISPLTINGKQHLFETKEKVSAEDITFKEITGPAGTCMVMNSHLVHRASFPKTGYRLAMHLGFTLDGDQYFHREYNQREFYDKK